jgi:hypothetical protein
MEEKFLTKEQERKKRYYEKNKERINEEKRNKYAENPDLKKEYNTKNKNIITEYKKKWYEDNKKNINYDNIKVNKQKYNKSEKGCETNKTYYQKNKESLSVKNKEWRNNNKKKLSIYKKEYRKNDLNRLIHNLRNNISRSIKNNGFKKKSKTQTILGCTFKEFKDHIESQWESWMTWENYGLYNGELNYGWDIDHIIPSSSAISEEDVCNLNHYTNLKPLCSYHNRNVKRNKLIN